MKKLYFLIILASMAFLIGCGPDPKPPEDDQPPPCVGDECEDAPPAPPDPPEPDTPEPKEDEPDPEPEPAPDPEPEPDEAVLIELNRAELKEQKQEQKKEEELIVEEKDAAQAVEQEQEAKEIEKEQDADESVQPPKAEEIMILPPEESDAAFSEMGMVYFAYDKSEITADFEEVIQKNYEWIFQNPDAQVQLEGHCDERGTNEYNLALGERRAKAVFDHLVGLGANPSQFTIVSFGEERPAVYGSNESSWRQNRRVEFTRL